MILSSPYSDVESSNALPVSPKIPAGMVSSLRLDDEDDVGILSTTVQDDTKVVYVSGIPEDIQEYFIQSVFKPFGNIAKVTPNAYGYALMFNDAENAQHAAEQLDGCLIFGQEIRVKYASPFTGTPIANRTASPILFPASLATKPRPMTNYKVNGIPAHHLPIPTTQRTNANQISNHVDSSNFHPIQNKEESQKRNLYILNLPLDMTTDELISIFEAFGHVIHCCILATLDRVGKRRAFIDMASATAAEAAMKGITGCIIRSYQIDVSYAAVQRSGNPIVRSEGTNTKRSSFTLDPPSAASNRKLGAKQNPWTALSWSVCIDISNLESFSIPSSGEMGTIGSASVQGNCGGLERATKEEIVERVNSIGLGGRILEWDWKIGKLTFENREDAESVVKSLNGWRGLKVTWWKTQGEIPNPNWSSSRQTNNRTHRSFSLPMTQLSGSIPSAQQHSGKYSTVNTFSPWSSTYSMVPSSNYNKITNGRGSLPFMSNSFNTSQAIGEGIGMPNWMRLGDNNAYFCQDPFSSGSHLQMQFGPPPSSPASSSFSGSYQRHGSDFSFGPYNAGYPRSSRSSLASTGSSGVIGSRRGSGAVQVQKRA